MKAKKFDKKLNLNKTTISDLTKTEMQSAKGGDSQWYPGCWSTYTCYITPCDTDLSCILCPD